MHKIIMKYIVLFLKIMQPPGMEHLNNNFYYVNDSTK